MYTMKTLAAALIASFILAPGYYAYNQAYMTCLVNAERARAGLDPVGIDSRLTISAQGHSDWQAAAQTMSHTGAGGSSPGDRIDAAGFSWQNMGENVAYGYDTEDLVMEKWMDSPGHRANILNGAFNMMGSAVSFSGDDTPYWTQNFGNDGSPTRNLPNCNGKSSSGGNDREAAQPVAAPVSAPAPAPVSVPAPPLRELTPEELGLTPIQPATDGVPSDGPTGPIIVVTPSPNAPSTGTTSSGLPVVIPANSSPVSPQDLAAASLPPAPAPAPASTPAPEQPKADNGPSKPTGKPMTAIVSAQSASPEASSPSAFASHALTTGPSSNTPHVTAASVDSNTRRSPFTPHVLANGRADV